MSSMSTAAKDPLSRAAILGVLQDLVRIPSVNPALARNEARGETEIAAFACEWMNQRGIRAWTEEPAPGRPNAVGEVGRDHGRTLVFCAHLDTVGTEGMTILPFEPRLEDGRVYGRGAYDMKGSAAALLSAAASLAADSQTGRLMVALVSDEEYASIGAQDFVKRHSADACILTEPSEGKLILAHKGFVWVELVTRGKAAHGSRWDLGVSAIGKMGRIIAAMEAFDRDELRRRTHPLVGPASQHCALVQGGSGLSTYSAECRLTIERRTLPGETPEQAIREIREVVRAAGEDAEVRPMLDRPPLVCSSDSPIARCVQGAAEAVMGSRAEEAGVGYWMDAALFAAAGIPTVNYGPTGAGAHEAVEWVDLDSVANCARVLAESARQFFQMAELT